jgi:hypothetical protein
LSDPKATTAIIHEPNHSLERAVRKAIKNTKYKGKIKVFIPFLYGVGL